MTVRTNCFLLLFSATGLGSSLMTRQFKPHEWCKGRKKTTKIHYYWLPVSGGRSTHNFYLSKSSNTTVEKYSVFTCFVCNWLLINCSGVTKHNLDVWREEIHYCFLPEKKTTLNTKLRFPWSIAARTKPASFRCETMEVSDSFKLYHLLAVVTHPLCWWVNIKVVCSCACFRF